MKTPTNLYNLPTVDQLIHYYLSRDGIPLEKRAWFNNPFEIEDGLTLHHYQWYQMTKFIAYQEAINQFERELDSPWIAVDVFSDDYPPLFDTCIAGEIQFHNYHPSGDWVSKTYLNPTYGDLINAASKSVGLNPGEFESKLHLPSQFEPEFVPGKLPGGDDVIGVYIP